MEWRDRRGEREKKGRARSWRRERVKDKENSLASRLRRSQPAAECAHAVRCGLETNMVLPARDFHVTIRSHPNMSLRLLPWV